MIISSLKARWRHYDYVLLASVLLLAVIGLAALYSISLGYDPVDFTNFRKQLIYFGFGLLIAFIASLLNYSAFRVYSRYFYWGAAILLVLVAIFGTTLRGTRGWFSLFGFYFQPVELAKVALLFFLAKFFSNRYQFFNEWRHVIVSLFGTLILAFFVLMQPDTGSAAVLLGLWFILLMVTGVRWRYLGVIMLTAIVLVSILWFGMFADYQKARIMTFLNPAIDPLGSGYNVTQAKIAVGSGGVFGRGLGFGSQSQLKFIPESQTDFIFAVIAEELGLLGVALVLGLWVLIFYRLARAAKRARDDFGQFVLLGILIIFFIHIFVNIGMNIGLLPVTGISLPFLSYGGSFVLVSMFFIGVAESVIASK